MEELAKTLQETVNRLSNQIVQLTAENESLRKMNQHLKDEVNKLQEENKRHEMNADIRKAAKDAQSEINSLIGRR